MLVPIPESELDEVQRTYLEEFRGAAKFFHEVNGYAVGCRVSFAPSSAVPPISSGKIDYIVVVERPPTGYLIVTGEHPQRGPCRVRVPFPIHID